MRSPTDWACAGFASAVCPFALQTCCQHFILLQPFLSSLKREVRSYFFHGRHWKTLRTANAVKTKQMLSVSCVERDDAGNVDADLMLQISLPGLVDQAVHALGLLEQRYKLVSSSALLRVDQGVEFVPVVRPLPNSPRSALTDAQKQVVDTAERNAINRRKPQVWMASGSGWITRSFINEVSCRWVAAQMGGVEIDVHTYRVAWSWT